jgi:hypothetical protein
MARAKRRDNSDPVRTTVGFRTCGDDDGVKYLIPEVDLVVTPMGSQVAHAGLRDLCIRFVIGDFDPLY